MLMPKANLIKIYENLFNEGVMVAKKDVHAARHPNVDVPNLHVMKALNSLKSRGYVKEQFAWRHYYWYLTNDGIQYLRDFLHLPPEIVPSTLKRHVKAESRPRAAPSSRPYDKPAGETDRSAYRRNPGSAGAPNGDKTGAAGPGAATMEFRGGYGRGKPE
uniref:40S ribosomal protein S10 n=1 Tax=Caligus clemensi TaxID=344056 RepID=C1C2T7_CALCM|nr:40S ribosomal protein S10 [Caligus clemensi]